MIFIKKWQRLVKWLIFLAIIFLAWQVLKQFSKIESTHYSSYGANKEIPDHWGINNDDIEWLPSLIKSKSEDLPIVLVEEHYEVLKYWFQAAELGLISKSRNILIHIDGHVDGAIPYDTENIPWFRFPALINFLIDEGHENLLCHKEVKLRGLFLQSTMQLLLNFSLKELKLLFDLGICFEVSPSSRYFVQSGRLHVCHGENVPKKSEVSFHYPSATEVTSQNVTLRKIISSVFRKPDLITVCRSIRDGYTPKKLHTTIEANILKTISNAYRSAHVDKVHYDHNLLGGKTGWPQRSHDWSEKLLQYLSVK